MCIRDRCWPGSGVGVYYTRKGLEGCAAEAFLWTFHVSFRCGRAGHEISPNGLSSEVWGTTEETCVSGFEEGPYGRVTEALVHELHSVFFGRSVVGEGCYFGRWLRAFWGVTYTGAGSRWVCS